MNPHIKIRRLTINGGNTSADYAFGPGVNVIVGGTGTGKTSMLQVIRWTLGGSAVRSAAVTQGVVSSALDLDLNGRRYVVSRANGERTTRIVEAGTSTTVAEPSVAGRVVRDHPTSSDALLGLLAMPRIELPRARRRATRDRTTVSFWDFFDYMYVSQSEMDSSVAHHNDPLRDPKRRATFEVIYGLIDEEAAGLERQLGELRSQVVESRRFLAGLRAWLAESGEPAEDALILAAERASADLAAARSRLDELRRDSRDATADAEGVRLSVLASREAVSSLEQRRAELQIEAARYTSLVAQLNVDLDRLERGEVAAEVLAPFEFRECPRCGQPIRSDRNPEGACPVCLQPDVTPDAEFLANEHDRLERQLSETESLFAATRADIASVETELADATAQLRRLSDILEDQTTAYVSPRFEAIADSSRLVAELTASHAAIQKTIDVHVRVRGLSASVIELETRIHHVERQLVEAKERLRGARQRLVSLSTIFDELIQSFDFPWYQAPGARIDEADYLPVVGDETFDQASGGMKTLLNVAYAVAGLRYGLREDDSLLPLFAILDSPRKNLGLLADRSIGEKVYRQFRSLNDAFADSFQLLVADNDPPPIDAEFHRIELTYESPFVPWITHPGPGQVEPVEE